MTTAGELLLYPQQVDLGVWRTQAILYQYLPCFMSREIGTCRLGAVQPNSRAAPITKCTYFTYATNVNRAAT